MAKTEKKKEESPKLTEQIMLNISVRMKERWERLSVKRGVPLNEMIRRVVDADCDREGIL